MSSFQSFTTDFVNVQGLIHNKRGPNLQIFLLLKFINMKYNNFYCIIIKIIYVKEYIKNYLNECMACNECVSCFG